MSIENIGLGGALVLIEDRISPGDAVTLSFTAPALWDPLVIRARVAWLGPHSGERRVGLAFEHKNAQAVLALYELIASTGYE